MLLYVEGKIDIFVGRICKDFDMLNGFYFWIVFDNLLKGVVWNLV